MNFLIFKLSAFGICVTAILCLAMNLSAHTYRWPADLVRAQQSPRAIPLVNAVETPIVVVVHKENRITNLSLKHLSRIYAGEVTEWPDGTTITPINRPILSEVRERFYRVVLSTKPTQKFFQAGSPIPFQTMRVDGEQAVSKFVSRDRGAIAYCYASSADGSVKILRLDGKAPEDDEYALK